MDAPPVDAPPVDAPPAPGPSDEYIFNTSYFHHFELEVAPEDWQYLQDNALLEQYVPATVMFEGRRYEGAAVRFKGSWNTLTSCFDETGQQTCSKLSYKVSFNEYGPGRFAGLRKLVFNSSVRDPSLMREVVSYWLYRQMGIRAPRATHAQLTVNGEWKGVFVLVEYVDKEFVEERWTADQGNVYKEVWPLHDTTVPYVEALRTNEAAPDVSGMLAFKSLLDSTTDTTFAADIAGTLDLSYMARYLAVDRAINNGDGATRFYCYDAPVWQECSNHNFYWYEEPASMMHLIPWDLDYTVWDANTDLGRAMWSDDCTPVSFCDYYDIPDCPPDTQSVGIMPGQCDPLMGFVHRATWNQYLVELATLVDGPMSVTAISSFLQAQRDKIADAVAMDPFGPGTYDWDKANEWLDAVLDMQRAAIDTLLAEQP